MIKNNQTIKQFKSQLSKLMGDVEALKVEVANKQKDYSTKLKMVNELKLKIEKLENPQAPEVSEHAIVRYFERVLNYDLAEIRKEILTDNVVKFIDELGGSGSYPSGRRTPSDKEYNVIIKNNIVVTVNI